MELDDLFQIQATSRSKLESGQNVPQKTSGVLLGEQGNLGNLSSSSTSGLSTATPQSEKWNGLLMSLRELVEWVLRKDSELSSVAHVLADIPCLHRQQDDLRAFRRELEARAPMIESNLSNGRNYLTNDASMSDASDTEDFSSSFESKKEPSARVARRELKTLSERWSSLNARLDVMQQRNNDLQAKTHKLQQTVDEAHQRLAQAESSIARWVALSDPGRADELMNEVTRMREHMAPIRRVVDEVREQAGRLQGSTVSLTPHMQNRLKDIQVRWGQVEKAVDDRWRRMSLSDSLRRDRQMERDAMRMTKRSGRAASEDELAVFCQA
ncbi:unnamed protein product [Notodromas monacha]|uniref:Dystrophin n=1 Tax=Notodromas monacha TaxID=399045 RepID=A0A7R9GG13_9CRUS|nr:unnamed protein product [Notodromas monacha]CAG0921228.1 unnamed protein product [Notodromas monacha]